MVVILSITLQVFLKRPLLNSIFLSTNLSMAAISSINLYRLASVWFSIYHGFNRVLLMYDISLVTEKIRRCR